MRRVFTLLCVLLCAAGVAAQPTMRLATVGTSGTITANGGSVTLQTGGMGSGKIQTSGTWSGTVEAQCSTNGVLFDPDDEVPMTLLGGSPASEISNAEGIYDLNVAGCATIRVIATAWTSGALTVLMQATTTGGGSGGSGGGGAVSISQGGNTATVTAGGLLSVDCPTCTGSGVQHIDDAAYTVTTDDFVPVGGMVDDTTPDTVPEGEAGVARMTTNRAPHTNPRDAAGAEIFGTAAAAADNTANPTFGGARTFLHVFDGTTWDRWQGAVTVISSALPTGAAVNTSVDEIETILTSFLTTIDADTGALVNQIFDLDTAAGTDNTVAIAIAIGASGGAVPVSTTNRFPVTCDNCGTPPTDTEDGAIATGQTAGLVANLMYIYNTTTAQWERAAQADATQGATALDTGPQLMLQGITNLDGVTAVTNGQTTKVRGDSLGRQITILGCNREDRIRGYLANTDGASTALTGMGAQGAGIIIEVWSFVVTNSSATDVTVDIRDGTAGSVLTTLPAPATTDTLGGAVVNLNIPITFTANTAVAMDASAAASTVFVTAIGCTVK